MKVAIYARVSTKDKGQEVENQLRQLREFAAVQGWTVYREFIDHETAKTDEGAEFQAMFTDASQRKFDMLLFWALDRLTREGVEGLFALVLSASRIALAVLPISSCMATSFSFVREFSS
jgi:DNA invertase Pin-like site-specific DNA recombinase